MLSEICEAAVEESRKFVMLAKKLDEDSGADELSEVARQGDVAAALLPFHPLGLMLGYGTVEMEAEFGEHVMSEYDDVEYRHVLTQTVRALVGRGIAATNHPEMAGRLSECCEVLAGCVNEGHSHRVMSGALETLLVLLGDLKCDEAVDRMVRVLVCRLERLLAVEQGMACKRAGRDGPSLGYGLYVAQLLHLRVLGGLCAKFVQRVKVKCHSELMALVGLLPKMLFEAEEWWEAYRGVLLTYAFSEEGGWRLWLKEDDRRYEGVKLACVQELERAARWLLALREASGECDEIEEDRVMYEGVTRLLGLTGVLGLRSKMEKVAENSGGVPVGWLQDLLRSSVAKVSPSAAGKLEAVVYGRNPVVPVFKDEDK